VNQPIELAHEEIEVEVVPVPEGAKTADAGQADFREEEIFIPLRREVAEVTKSARISGEARARKKVQKDRETISDTIRKEDVQVDEEKDMGR